MTEGSVEVDTGSMPSAPATDTGSSQDDSQADTGSDDSSKGQTDGEGKTDGDVSDKGTKLDEDPLSRANQLRANAEAKVRQYERVLSDQDLLKRYAREAGMTLSEAKEELKEAKVDQQAQYAPDRFNTSKDVADVLNELRGNFSKEVEALRKENQQLKEWSQGFSESDRVRQITNNMTTDVSTIREKYSVLNPKSTDYDKDLENKIGEIYHKLDFDEQKGGYRGNVSLAKITDDIMSTVELARKKGSESAQTQVKVRQAGKVVSSSKSSSSKEESGSKDPSTAIAERISRAMGNG